MTGAQTFVRDRSTVLAYLALAAFAYCLYALGPVLAFLRDDFHLSYTLTSLHSTLWAGGTIVTGLTFDRVARALERRRLFWLSALGTAAGALLFAATTTVALTLLAAAVLGTAGTMLQSCTSSVLSDRHQEHRDRALVEANVGASTAAVLAPIAFGLLHPTPLGWRSALLVPVLVLGSLYLIFRGVALPARPPPGAGPATGPRLGAAYWLLCLLVATVVGMEFCVVFYAAPLLRTSTGIATTQAAAALTAFYVGELLGRLAGGRLTRRSGNSVSLLLGSLALSAAGFLAFWWSGHTLIAAAGLFVTGVGTANLYPLALALAVAAAPGLTDLAVARTQVSVGAAVAVAPLALGTLADAVGVRPAFTVEPVLIALALLLLAAGWRGARSSPAGAPR